MLAPPCEEKDFGSFLVEKGALTQSELDIVVWEQARSTRSFRQVVLSLGLLKRPDFFPLFSQWSGYPYFSLETDLDVLETHLSSVCSTLQEQISAHPGLIVRQENTCLHIVLEDPQDFWQQISLQRLFPSFQLIFYLGCDLEIAKRKRPSSLVVGEEEYTQRLIEESLFQAVQQGASDVHWIPEESCTHLFYRIDGVMEKQQTFHHSQWERLSVALKLKARLDIAQTRHPQDGRFLFASSSLPPIDCRLSVIPTLYGESFVIRLLRSLENGLNLKELGFSPDIQFALESITQEPRGIFLIAGPTGCGKTTTIYSLLTRIHRQTRTILTIEDPVEYRIPGIRQTEIHPGGPQMKDILRSLLRHDPDVLYVSEIRDQATASLALHAALTGHLVFATLHAGDLGSLPRRLEELGLSWPSLSEVLLGCMTQRLVRRFCEQCQGQGCPSCRQRGYKGRIGIGEISLTRPLATSLPFLSLEDQGQNLIQKALTSREEIERVLGTPLSRSLSSLSTFQSPPSPAPLSLVRSPHAP